MGAERVTANNDDWRIRESFRFLAHRLEEFCNTLFALAHQVELFSQIRLPFQQLPRLGV